jgi:Fe-S-cluster-containing dehydrogenase component
MGMSRLVGSDTGLVDRRSLMGGERDDVLAAVETRVGRICGACAGDCIDACFNDAIRTVAGGGVVIDPANCAGCGACIPACDLALIRLEQGVACLRRTIEW